MTFDLPNQTAFLTVFFAVAVVAAVATVGALTAFFAENHTTRVRRHEGVLEYYGHLILGH
jgi:hypothetical protein